jgi:hypothetical protein
MAKRKTFAGYKERRRARWFDYSTRNFQTWRLAQGVAAPFGLANQNVWNRAQKTLETIPLVGVVEEFDLSIRGFQGLLGRDFPNLAFESVRANVTQPAGSTLDDRLAQIQTELGPDRFDLLVRDNELDLKLHAIARERLINSTLEVATVGGPE